MFAYMSLHYTLLSLTYSSRMRVNYFRDIGKQIFLLFIVSVTETQEYARAYIRV